MSRHVRADEGSDRGKGAQPRCDLLVEQRKGMDSQDPSPHSSSTRKCSVRSPLFPGCDDFAPASITRRRRICYRPISPASRASAPRNDQP